MLNVYTSSSVEIANSTVVDVKLSLESEKIKQLVINTNGPIRFSKNRLFDQAQGIITFTTISGTNTVQKFTEIAGEKKYDLTPLLLMGKEEITFRITNSSGVTLRYQLDLLK